MFYGKKGFAIEQIFIIGLFLIVFVIIVGLIGFVMQKARAPDKNNIDREFKINVSKFIYDGCEEFLDKELGVLEFYDLFYFVFSGACGRGVEGPYLIKIAFPLDGEILQEVAKDADVEVNYVGECVKIKNSKTFIVDEEALGSFEFLIYSNSVGGVSICSYNREG